MPRLVRSSHGIAIVILGAVGVLLLLLLTMPSYRTATQPHVATEPTETNGGTPPFASTAEIEPVEEKILFGESSYDYSKNYLGIGTVNPTLSLQVAGTIGPTTDNASSLGTPNLRWQDLYLGPHSLHLQTTVKETGVARDWSLGIETDPGANRGALQILEGTAPYLRITPTGSITLAGPLSVIDRLDITGAAVFKDDLMVDGATTLGNSLAANGGISFDQTTDTISAFTAGGTIDLNTNILTNLGNAGTDFVVNTGALTLAGDLTLSNNTLNCTACIEALDLAARAIDTSKIAPGAVTAAEILDDTIGNDDVTTNAAIAYSKLNLTGALTAADLATDSVGAAELIASGVSAGSYGSAGAIPVLTIDADGRVTSVSSATISAGITDDSLDFSHFKDTLLLDAGLTVTGTAGETLSLVRTLSDTGAENGTTLTVTAADTTGATTAQYGLYLDNAASTEGLDSLLVLDNSDTDDAVGTAITLVNAGGGFTNVINNAGTLISGTELNVLDGGILLGELTDSGTLTVGTIDINGGAIDGTTIGASSASSGAFTTLSASGALGANGGITLDASTDTIGAFTAGGTIDLGGNILTNIGNAGTDFIATTGALTLAGTLTLSNNTLTCTACIDATDLGADSVETSEIATGAVATAEILDDTIANADINSAAAIAYSKLNLSGAILTGDIATDTILAGDIAAGAVATAEILDGTIINGDLAGGSYAGITTVGTLTGLTVGVADGSSVTIDGDASPTADLVIIGTGDTSATDGVDALLVTSNVSGATGAALHVDADYTTSVADNYSILLVDAFTAATTANVASVVRGIDLGNLTQTENTAGNITATAFFAGTGWDTVLGGTTAATNILSFTNVTVTTGGDATFAGGDITGANSAAIDIGEAGEAGEITFTAGGTGDFNFATDSDSFVGIGTASPSYNLVVSNAGASGLEVAPGVDMGGASVSGTVLLQAYNRSGSAYAVTDFSAASYRFGVAGSAEVLIDASGNLTTATAGTNTLGTSSLEWAGLLVGDDGSGVTFGADQDVGLSYISASSSILFNLTDGNKLNVDGDGSPTADLFVIGAGDTSATDGVDALLIDFDVATGKSGDAIDVTSSIGIQDGSDAFIGIDMNLTGADHSGASNVITGLDLSLTTPDASSTESAMVIGSNWDNSITVGSGEMLFSGGNLQLNDSINLTVGTGDDLTIVHNGTDTIITSATGNLNIDNTNTTGTTLFTLGADTSATSLVIENNSGTDLFTFSAGGALKVGPYGASAGNTGELQFLELGANGSHYVAFKAPDSIAGNVTWTLPSADSSGAFFSDGAGNITISAIDNNVAQGRLTLTSGTAVTTADVTGATTIYYTPYQGDRVALYDGTRWKMYTFTERSLALGTLTADKNYDVFLYDNSGTLTLELSAAWTNATTRADALATQNGVRVKSGATTRRLVGTIRTTSTTATEDSATKRFVRNENNAVRRRLYTAPGYSDNSSETTLTETTNATWREINGGTSSKVEFLSDGENPYDGQIQMFAAAGGGGSLHFGIAEDSTSTPQVKGYTNETSFLSFQVGGQRVLSEGYHYLDYLVRANIASATIVVDDDRDGASFDTPTMYLEATVLE